jgi:pimeloyl-ACP methyl ester carboxylesterase
LITECPEETCNGAPDAPRIDTVNWLWVAVVLSVMAGLVLLGANAFHFYLRWRFLDTILRVFQEKPLFISPRGQPVPSAEDVVFPTGNGLMLRGCYLRHSARQRRGVILFGLEYGSNRWACLPYCEQLLDAGYDIFAFEPRGQGESDPQPGYEPLQWVTELEVEDSRAALTYLKGRSDADPRGVGLLGISKGGGAGLLAAVDDPWVRCFVTDGIFATHATLVRYMRKWIAIYSTWFVLQRWVPLWYYSYFAGLALRRLSRVRCCRFPHLEKAMARLGPRPLFMIHGGGDTYIKPELAEALFARARASKELWMVEGAKHNQALHLAADEYKRRVLDFFNENLGEKVAESVPMSKPAPVQLPVNQLVG